MAIHLSKIPYICVCAFILSALPGIFFLTGLVSDDSFSLPLPRSSSTVSKPALNINLPLSQEFTALSIGDAREQLFFSRDPVRPDSQPEANRFLIRLGKSKQMKRFELPARLDLAFDSSGILTFFNESCEPFKSLDFSPEIGCPAESLEGASSLVRSTSERSPPTLACSQDLAMRNIPSLFWVYCRPASENELTAFLMYQMPDGTVVEQSHWNPSLEETPLQSAAEFPEGSSFRALAEARWWGRDLLMEKAHPGACVQRLEIGASSSAYLIDCSLRDWLVYKENKWEKLSSLEESEGFPIAHIKVVSAQNLEIEGWNESFHVRLKLPFALLPALKMKGEDLLSQLRVRSERQVSCMLDKQCLVLRPGDWVLKVGSRWKTLRKNEDKEAVLEGRLVGDLFILDRIDTKSSAKSITGYYFVPGRTQSALIEYAQKIQKGRKRGG